MGQFDAGHWMILLLGYFFIFFIIMYSIVASMDYFGIEDDDISYSGQVNGTDPYANGRCTKPGTAGSLVGFRCDRTLGQTDEDICESIQGCSWRNETEYFGFYVRPAECEGYINISHYNDDVSVISGSYCDVDGFDTNQTICESVGCTWESLDSLAGGDIEDPAYFIDTITLMTGFNADIGLPTSVRFIFSMLAFYVPLLMLIWSIYMSLPIIH